MRMVRLSSTTSASAPRRLQATAARVLLAAVLGLASAGLVACGSSGKGLIPVDAAGPLQSDFEAVAQDAQSAEGNCASTEAALAKTSQDFVALPSSVDAGLRNTLRQGIANLSKRALVLCAQPLGGTATTTTPKTTPSTTTTTPPTTTTTTPTTTSTPTTTTTPTEPGPGGGTPAPGEGEAEGGAGAGSAGGVGAGGQEGGK
jgi:hypothetical protein